jgi:diaminopimelate epimerase
MLKGLTDRTVKVRTSMGGLTVEWAADGQVYQTGPAEVVFEGEYPAC